MARRHSPHRPAPATFWIALHERPVEACDCAALREGQQRAGRRRQGQGHDRRKIVEIAKANDIPIEENEILAGALSKVELGEEIPPDLYKAVAEVLVFVLRLSGRR